MDFEQRIFEVGKRKQYICADDLDEVFADCENKKIVGLVIKNMLRDKKLRLMFYRPSQRPSNHKRSIGMYQIIGE